MAGFFPAIIMASYSEKPVSFSKYKITNAFSLLSYFKTNANCLIKSL